jgi:phage N-6-adenine-methyltransferase
VTLAGFSARNHPQQTKKRGPNPMVDDRGTDPALFAKLDARFHFTIDVAASAANAKCERYFTVEDDGLAQSWRTPAREHVWCNPPYSNIEPWVQKAHAEMNHISWSPRVIVMLLPANRTEQGWWQRQVEPYRDKGEGFRVEFLPGRPRFVAPDKPGIGPNERPPFGCCLLVWGDP